MSAQTHLEGEAAYTRAGSGAPEIEPFVDCSSVAQMPSSAAMRSVSLGKAQQVSLRSKRADRPGSPRLLLRRATPAVGLGHGPRVRQRLLRLLRQRLRVLELLRQTLIVALVGGRESFEVVLFEESAISLA